MPFRSIVLLQLFLLLLLLLLLFAVSEVQDRRLYPNTDERQWNREKGQPGVKLRLTKKGANHVKTVGVKLLNEQIALLKGINTRQKFSSGGLEGHVDLQNIRVSAYRPPSVSVINFKPPMSIVLGIEDMDISLNGQFVGHSGLFSVPGRMNGDLKRMTVVFTTKLEASTSGRMTVEMVNCSTVVGSSVFAIHPEGPFGPVVKTFEGVINVLVREKIPQIFCQTFKKIVEGGGPILFDRLLQAPLGGSFKRPTNDGINILATFVQRLTNDMIIDNANIASPVITNDYFETRQKGEVRYRNSRTGTPFFPLKMNTTEDSGRMLYIYGSDYLFNSMLYHAYQKNRLLLKVDFLLRSKFVHSFQMRKETLPRKYRSFLRTSCSAENAAEDDVFSRLCVGSLLPSLGSRFPNSTVSFVLLPHGLPTFQFDEDKGSLAANARILTYIRNGRKRPMQVLVSAADGQADVHLKAEQSKVAGDLRLNRLNLRVHRSALPGMDPRNIEQLSPLTKTILGPLLSKGLKKGVPFPIQDTIAFKNPVLISHEGYVELATDFVLGEAKLRREIAKAFQDGINNLV